MKINESTTLKKWHEIKDDIQKAWGELTNDELAESKGDVKKNAGLIQKKYGEMRKGHRENFAEIFNRPHYKKDLKHQNPLP